MLVAPGSGPQLLGMYHICDLVLMGRGPPGGLQDQVGHPTTITGELGAILFTIAIAATTTAIDSFIAHDSIL